MAMEIKRDGIQLCDDCLIVAVNGDYSGIDEHWRVVLSQAARLEAWPVRSDQAGAIGSSD